MYLACATCPDIAYAVSKAARSMAALSTLDWICVKRIFKYLKGTIDFGLNYTLSGDGLCAYSDADLAGDLSTQMLTNDFVSFSAVLQSLEHLGYKDRLLFRLRKHSLLLQVKMQQNLCGLIDC